MSNQGTQVVSPSDQQWLNVEHCTLRECSLQLTQDPVGFAQPKLHDFIGARLRIAGSIDAQPRCVARRPYLRDIAIVEIDAHAIAFREKPRR